MKAGRGSTRFGRHTFGNLVTIIECRYMRLLCLLLISFQVAPACSISILISIHRQSADPLFRFSDGKQVGYINPKGKVVIPAAFAPDARQRYGGEFHDGLSKVSDGLSWFIDQFGKISTAKFYEAFDFSEGLAAVQPTGNLKWGFIDRTGALTIAALYDRYPGPFSEGLARVEISGRTGYIDRSGNFAIPATFSYGSDFQEGIAIAVVDGPCRIINGGSCAGPRFGAVGPPSGEVDGKRCKFTFIDHSGKTISEDRYDGTGVFSEGLAAVEMGGKWGYIDKSGKLAIDTVLFFFLCFLFSPPKGRWVFFFFLFFFFIPLIFFFCVFFFLGCWCWLLVSCWGFVVWERRAGQPSLFGLFYQFLFFLVGFLWGLPNQFQSKEFCIKLSWGAG